MAVTIEQNPAAYAPVYNPIEYVLSSDNTGNDNFKFLVDVYINGAVTKEIRLPIPIVPGTNTCVVSLQRILEATLTSDLGVPTSTDGFSTCGNSILSYVVKFGEEYDVASVLTQFPDLTVDSTRYAWNGSLKHPEWIDLNHLDYVLTDFDKKFLTNAPTTQETSITDHGWVYMLSTGANQPNTLRVRTYDSNDSLIQTVQINNTFAAGSTAERILKVPANPASLNNVDGSHITSGAQPIITSSVKYYLVDGFNSPSVISQTYRFDIVEPCRYTKRRLIFLNRMGGFDGYNFNLVSTESESIERKYYKKNPTRLSGTTLTYDRKDREQTQYYTKSQPKMKLISDFFTDDTSVWLEELISSPEIYLEDGNELIALKSVNMDMYLVKTTNVHKLFNLEVEIDFTYNNYRQRG